MWRTEAETEACFLHPSSSVLRRYRVRAKKTSQITHSPRVQLRRRLSKNFVSRYPAGLCHSKPPVSQRPPVLLIPIFTTSECTIQHVGSHQRGMRSRALLTDGTSINS
ncbi:hypothetical protein VTK56DRAFT_8211 [Thermocarpiscus australiensis]